MRFPQRHSASVSRLLLLRLLLPLQAHWSAAAPLLAVAPALVLRRLLPMLVLLLLPVPGASI